MFRISLFYLLLFFSTFSFSQENIALGTWRFHPSVGRGKVIAASDEKLYVAIENGVLVIDPTDNSIETLNLENSLSSLEPSYLAVSSNNRLVIGYTDGNIDIIEDNVLTNIPDFKIFTNTSAILDSKTINHISFKGADTAFFATASGVLAYNLNTNLIIYEMIFNQGTPLVDVQATAYHSTQDSLYIIADSALYRIENPEKSTLDVTDLSMWDNNFTDALTNLSSIAIHDDTVYIGTADSGVYYLDGNTFVSLPAVDSGKVNHLSVEGDTLFAIYDDFIIKSESTQNAGFDTIQNNAFEELTAMVMLNGTTWLSSNSLLPVITNSTGTYDFLSSLSHLTNGNYTNIDYLDEGVVLTPTTFVDKVEFSSFSEGSWQNENPLIANIPDSLGKLTKVIKANDTFYFGTEGSGLYASKSLTNGDYESLSFADLSNTATINDMYVDASENLWILQNSNNLCKIDPSGIGTCPYFIFDVSKKMLIDNSDNFWFISNSNRLSVYNDDFTQFNLNIEDIVIDEVDGTSTINDMALDLDGELWFASADGIGFYPNPSLQSGTALRPTENGFPILNNLNIEKIIVDGANRKWIVTQNDITYLKLLRADGKEVIEEYNEANSPLTTNQLNDIGLNNSSGELFVATTEGLYSYRTDASAALATHSNVKVFPNPIPPNYSGVIAISGLVRDADVKITDISGNLIYETTSEGGTATWSGIDYTGSQAKTGVYLVFSSSEDGQETFVTKVAIVE